MQRAALITALITSNIRSPMRPQEVKSIYEIVRVARRAAPEPVGHYNAGGVARFLCGSLGCARLGDSPTWVEAQEDVTNILANLP